MQENIEHNLSFLEAKDSKEAFTAIKYLEKISETAPTLYPYIEKFVRMASNKKYTIRVRGFKLFCMQAQWDTDNTINSSLPDLLFILNDEKPTAVRQSLAALHNVAKFKPELRDIIWNATSTINVEKYREDTMRPIIEKDISILQELISCLQHDNL